jgi:hypothetical protein
MTMRGIAPTASLRGALATKQSSLTCCTWFIKPLDEDKFCAIGDAPPRAGGSRRDRKAELR